MGPTTDREQFRALFPNVLHVSSVVEGTTGNCLHELWISGYQNVPD